jgi:phenylpropionate dioxygenase-like ring-hydroxylating dioxygenase large terminal subunit
MDESPDLARAPVPTLPYVSESFFEEERTRIFTRCWINVGRVEYVSEDGAYFVRKLEVAKASVLVVRGVDGQIRAFHNMCSHRGNPVAWEERGKCRTFACRFHGWTYDTSGALIHVSDKNHFFGVNPAENGLTAIHCDVWQGFIFINLDARPDQSLADFMAPVSDLIDGYPFGSLERSYSYVATEKVNWKTLVEAQLEGWHLPYLHANTLAKSATNKGQRFTHAALRRLGAHGLVASHAPDNPTMSPVTLVSAKFGVGTFDAFSIESADSAKGPRWHGAFDLYHVFPNFYIGLLRGTYFTYNIWPLAPNETRWEVTGYYPPPRNAGQLFSQAVGRVGLRDTLREDAFTHEKIGSVIGSGAKSHFHLQDEETAIRHFLDQIERHLHGTP